MEQITSNQTLTVLKKARRVIADPNHWTRHVLARDANGHFTDEFNAEAVCWCSVGALNLAAAHTGYLREVHSAIVELEKEIRTVNRQDACLSHYNDSHTHDEVLTVWDATIARLERT